MSRRTLALVVAACTLCTIGTVSRASAQAAAPAAADRTLVMPFENVTRESRIVWLGEAAAVLLADDLNALGGAAITRDERRQAFERLQVPPAAALTDATVIRIAQLVRAGQVIVGTLRLEGDDVVVQARAISIETARVRAEVTERGPLPELFATFERMARRFAPPSARGAEPEGRLVHPPVAAFENYIKGLVAETPATAISYLNAALQADPTLERARIALWEVFDLQGEHERALAIVGAVSPAAPQARRAQFRAGLSQLQLNRLDHAFATFKALADSRPTAAVLNNLGVVQMRRGGNQQPTGVPAYYFTRAADEDATEPDYFFNLGYAVLVRTRHRGGYLLAARSRASRPGRRRRTLRARYRTLGCRAARRIDAGKGAGPPPVVHL